jgi:hypothetical protein
VVERRGDDDLPHAFGRPAVRRRADELHRQLPPALWVEVAVDDSEGTAGDLTARLERGQFGGRGRLAVRGTSALTPSDSLGIIPSPFSRMRSYRRSATAML